jgi:hypothetical protein
MATVTDLADIPASVTAGYVTSRYTVVSQGQKTFVTKLSKYLTQPLSGQFEFMGLGASTIDTATADANALIALNTNRRHRYAASPGAPSGATVVPNAHGDVLVVDVS